MSNSPTRISRFGFVNAYLVPEDDGLTLVDTLLPRSAKAILRAAEELGAPIVRIALTHAHGDHIGSLDDARRGAAGRRGPHLGPRRPAAGQGQVARSRRAAGQAARQLPGRQDPPDAHLAPGDMVGSLEVVAAPGHTPGHVAFFDRRDGTLLCGDAFTTLGGVATTDKARLPFPLAGMATWHGPTELETARALRALQPARLAPGHGKVVESPLAAMDAAIAKAAV